MSNNKQDKKPHPNKLPKMRFNLYWLYGAIAIILIFLHFTGDETPMKGIDYSYYYEQQE